MVTLTATELDEMKAKVAAGELPVDAVKQHFDAEDRNVYGHDAKRRRDGSYIEQGVGSAGNQSRNSIEAYKKYCSHEPDFEKTVARMEKELAETNARRRAAQQQEIGQ
jgi:hypothetical protein